jgi:hypothetical protein
MEPAGLPRRRSGPGLLCVYSGSMPLSAHQAGQGNSCFGRSRANYPDLRRKTVPHLLRYLRQSFSPKKIVQLVTCNFGRIWQMTCHIMGTRAYLLQGEYPVFFIILNEFSKSPSLATSHANSSPTIAACIALALVLML